MSRFISFENCREEFPFMPYELCYFFSMQHARESKIEKRTIFQFSEYYKNKYSSAMPQPQTVVKMCVKLCENNILDSIRNDGFNGLENSYLFRKSVEVFDKTNIFHKALNVNLSYRIFGFKEIYNDYLNYTLAIEHTLNNNDKTLGTGFLYKGGFVTARHCIEGAKKIAIKGLDPEELRNAKFWVASNQNIDLLYIEFEKEKKVGILFDKEAEILEEVMTLGYPNVSGYHNFLAAENARVSSRFTASKGQVVTSAKDIWLKENLFLISARITKGNSGGPVVANDGSVIGVSINLPYGEGYSYDEMGYGTVIPISFVNDIIEKTDCIEFSVEGIEFGSLED